MIVFARHGQTPVNREGRLQGRSDASLTELGATQADRLAAAVAGRLPTRLLTSPLARARETAARIAARTDLEVEIDDRLVELDYGSWEGRPLGEVSADEWARWRSDPTFAPSGGESLLDVSARVATLCDDLAGGDTVVAVSHVSPIKAAVIWALGASEALSWRMHLAVASITAVDRRGETPVLLSFNEVAHLRE